MKKPMLLGAVQGGVGSEHWPEMVKTRLLLFLLL